MLSRAEARLLLDAISVNGRVESGFGDFAVRAAALFGALAARGETEEELAGFVDSLRAQVVPIPLGGLSAIQRSRLVDTCGTGGDLSGTFNISTAAALVAAAAGAVVAKHGNRAVTSRCGSADVLEALGIAINHSPAEAAEALRRYGFAFLPAPSLHPAMKAVMPLRRALGVRTAFNLLGPMTNPAGAPAQVLGVYAEHLVPVVAHTLARLNTQHAFVVHGFGTDPLHGIDEFSISGPTMVGEVRGEETRFSTILPRDFELELAPIETLAGGDAEANAAILRRIFAGQPGPSRDVVVMNAGAVLVVAQLAGSLLEGARLAQSTLDSGKVEALVLQLTHASAEEN